jgi:tetratricopeptide (TPR) repeat protein
VARYTPMIDGEALLALVPMSDRMKDIDQKIKSESITEAALRGLMVKSSRNPTNLELYTWARHVYANLDEYATDPVHKLIQCSMHALSQRGFEAFVVSVSLEQAAANLHYRQDTKSIDLPGLEQLGLVLSPLVDPKTLGDASIQVAEREIAQGRFLSAENHVKVATASYAAANDALGTYRTAMLSTRIQLAVGSIDAAQSLSTKVLAHLAILPAKDKSTALSNAASIDLAKGNRSAAIPEFIAASGYSIAAGQFTMAADLMVSSADASIKLGKIQDAKVSLTKAIAHYQSAKDTSGEAESVYKLVSVESALGDIAASRSNLERYLALQPQGVHSAEANELLAIRPNVY